MYRVTVTDVLSNSLTTTRTLQAWCKGNGTWIDDFSTIGDEKQMNSENTNELQIFPNPAADKVFIELSNATTATYTLTDLNGKLIGNGVINQSYGSINVDKIP